MLDTHLTPRAADIDGFVDAASHIIEREGGDDEDPNHGTVNAVKFEHYVAS